MASNSKIEWATHVWNPVVGCTKVSPGCANCYAETMSKRLAAMAEADMAKGNNPGRKANYSLVIRPDGHWNNKVVTVPEALGDPLKWRKPRRVFVNSMSDLFHKDVPFEFIDRVFAVMALTPQHTYQVLTKRPQRMAEYLNGYFMPNRVDSVKCEIMAAMPCNGASVDAYIGEEGSGYFEHGYLENVHLGTSVENQATADERIPHLLKCPAAVRFLSYEPALGPVDWGRSLGALAIQRMLGVGYAEARRIQESLWIISGGESGPHARPSHPDWHRACRDWCASTGVPYFFKQWGEWVVATDEACREHGKSFVSGTKGCCWLDVDGKTSPDSSNGMSQDAYAMINVGKHKAGRLLDGVGHNGMPEVQDA